MIFGKNTSGLLRHAAALSILIVPSLSGATINVTTGGTACGANGTCTSRAGATTIDFNSPALSGAPLPYTEGLATYSNGSGSPFVIGSVSGQYASPAGDSTQYLTVGSPSRPNPVTITFSSAINYFGFYYGSPDTYNEISFFSGNTQVGVTLQGDDLLNPADGNWATGEFINFDVVGGTIDKIVLSSSQAAFETDNHAYVSAVPEPISMALTGAGLLAVGCMRRLRRRS
jgi:hypothetical protein